MMTQAKYNFADVVIVEENLIGVVVKCWESSRSGFNYDVYVRSFNSIVNYRESTIMRFQYNKELSDEDLEFY